MECHNKDFFKLYGSHTVANPVSGISIFIDAMDNIMLRISSDFPRELSLSKSEAQSLVAELVGRILYLEEKEGVS